MTRLPRRIPRGGGILALQSIGSLSTLVLMLLYGNVLPRADFDEFAIWATSGAFLLGITQAIGADRVLIGRGSPSEGARVAAALGIAISAVQVGMSVWLHNPALALCSVLIVVNTLYDYSRIIHAMDGAWPFLHWLLVALALEVSTVLVARAAGVGGSWLLLCGAVVTSTCYLVATVRHGSMTRGDLRGGWGILWADRREAAPLILDAALAGAPIVIALATAERLGATGDASDARMALAVLGPVAIVGLAARRVIYAYRGEGRLSSRAVWAVRIGVAVVFASCVLMLSLTRTPVYGWVLPSFSALAWWTILGFAINHTFVAAALLPVAELRAQGRTLAIGVARVVATIAAISYLVLKDFSGVHDVAWSVASASIVYAGLVSVALRRGEAHGARLEETAVARVDAEPA